MAEAEGTALGLRLIAELRRWHTLSGAEMQAEVDDGGASSGDREVTDLLRWGADDVDDETLWAATITAVERAADDGERWALGDGLIDESIATRPNLRSRWIAARRTNPAVSSVFRVMTDRSWNWTHGPGSWWLDE